MKEKSRRKITNVTVRPCLNIDLSGLANRYDLDQWHHLSDIVIPKVNADKVHLLIGQDCSYLLFPLDIRKGQPGEPFAIQTFLGWLLVGLLTPLNQQSRHPIISTEEIFRVMADPVNRISPLTQQSLLVNCMNQLQRVERSRPAVATETLVSTESLIVETPIPVPHPRTSTPPDFPTVEGAMKVSSGSLMILDCPVPASLEQVAVLEAEKPKDSELIRRMLNLKQEWISLTVLSHPCLWSQF